MPSIWIVFSVRGTLMSDRLALKSYLNGTAGTAQADGAGTGSWTIGSSNSPKSFKIDAGAAVTPDEVGSMTARVVMAVPSKTIYLDPQIRT